MKSLLLTILCVVGVLSMHAQDYEFGEVSEQEVAATSYAQDDNAEAVVLHRSRETYFDYDHPEGWLITSEIHERIKILTKEGLEHATRKLKIFENNASKERVVNIKGYTFNLEGGKIDRMKLKNNGIFETEINESWKEISITMPNAKVGSVIELRYKIISPFTKIDDVLVQDDIPVAHFFAKIRMPDQFSYKRLVKGNFIPNPKDYSEGRNMSVSWEQDTNSALTQATKTGTMNIQEFINEYDYRDIPALKEEPYVDNLDNYRYTITYELNSIKRNDGSMKKYATSWREVAKTIYKSDNFGARLERVNFLKDDAARIAGESSGQLERMYKAFGFIKSHMNWNDRRSIYAFDNLQKAYKEKSGSVADINLMLVALLRELGLSANPVLASTRDHGIPAYPTREGFNYVLACVQVNNDFHLLDASEKRSLPNVLPTRILNWKGTLVKASGETREIGLYPDATSQRNVLLNVKVNDDGSVTGSQKANYTLTEALLYRGVNDNKPEQSLMESLINDHGFSDVSDLELKNMKDLGEAVNAAYSFEMDEGAEIIGNDMYILPLMHLRLGENPFTQEERNFPVDYAYPFSYRKIVSMQIPDGYKVTSLPTAISLSLPDGMGSFTYNIKESGGVISLQSSFKINHSVIPALKYPLLKEFYTQRVEKENEKVVLSKK